MTAQDAFAELTQRLLARQPLLWLNPALAPAKRALADIAATHAIGLADIEAADALLRRWGPALVGQFPELATTGGVIESPLIELADARPITGVEVKGRSLIKADHALPVAGSIKARGGIYEVLKHAEDLALAAGLIDPQGDYRQFASPRVRAFLGRHKVAVGSTGNLGLSIGIMSAQLGFQASVHMSSDARPWKKERLRAHGVQVFEYDSDYSVAVAQGRAEAAGDPSTHFVDDENSVSLFLGYAVAGRRLAGQFQALDVRVDADHPLLVYLPCGVGGGPGGVAFGLKTVFGDDVHCFFAEPTHAPCMLLGLYTGRHDALRVQDFGIDNVTAADGLAVGRPSGFVGRRLAHLIDGCFTVNDDTLFRTISMLHDSEAIDIEPSAAAGFAGPGRVLAHVDGLRHTGLDARQLAGATHIAWATGGSMVPREEMTAYIARGAALRR